MTEKQAVKPKDLKEFILNGCENEELAQLCEQGCEQLGLEDKSELYANFWSHELGALYCPDDELCELYRIARKTPS
jgi:hypothetical protein